MKDLLWSISSTFYTPFFADRQISFRQKVLKPNCNQRKDVQFPFVGNRAKQMLMKLTPGGVEQKNDDNNKKETKDPGGNSQNKFVRFL